MREQTKLAFWLLLFAVTCNLSPAFAQNMTTFSASNIQNAVGVKLASGTLYLQGTDQNNSPIGFQCGGGGQVVRTPYTTAVTFGAITSFSVCNPANTLPAGIFYHVWVVDQTTGSSTYGTTVLNYGLVQWSGSTFNLDNYQPSSTAVLPPTGGTVTGPTTFTGPVTLAAGCTGCSSSSSSGLGNGAEVLDVSTFSGADLTVKWNAAIAACSVGPCVYDLRGFTGSQAGSATVNIPNFSAVWQGPYTLSLATGKSINVGGGARLMGMGTGYTTVQKANTTSDYTPVITVSESPGGAEIDHFSIGNTTPNAPMIPLASVANPATCPAGYSGNCATYTVATTYADGGSYTFVAPTVGQQIGIWGFATVTNEGYYTVAATGTNTITVTNAGATAETPAFPHVPIATQSGGWGIVGGAHIHDMYIASSLGIYFPPDTYYQVVENNSLWTGYGALYVGYSSNANTFKDNFYWASDETGLASSLGSNSLGFMRAVGYGVRVTQSGALDFDGIDIENTRYSMVLSGAGITIKGRFYLENDLTGAGVLSIYNRLTYPILESGDHGINFTGSYLQLVNDWSGGSNRNSYPLPDNASLIPAQASQPAGSLLVQAVPDPTGGTAAATCTGTCATSYVYGVVVRDFVGSQESSSAPVHATLPETYTSVSNAATLSTANYNTIQNPNFGGVPTSGVACYDVLVSVSSIWKSLYTCLPPTAFPIVDNGSVTPSTYTAPTRNGTGDLSAGNLSDSGLILKSPGGTCYLVQVSNTPALTFTSVPCQ